MECHHSRRLALALSLLFALGTGCGGSTSPGNGSGGDAATDAADDSGGGGHDGGGGGSDGGVSDGDGDADLDAGEIDGSADGDADADLDAGAVDAAQTTDSGAAVDAGAGVDGGGSLTDAGSLTDGGGEPDSGVVPDSGTETDGGVVVPDSGTVTDGGHVVPDSGTVTDGGHVVPDGGTVTDSGTLPDSGGWADASTDASVPECYDSGDCNDEIGCTADICDEVTGSCRNVPNHGLCGAGYECDALSGCQQLGTCVTNADCLDANLCDGQERCDTVLWQCVPGVPLDCDDTVDCTVDTCNENATDLALACVHTPSDTWCTENDGLVCNGTDQCAPSDPMRDTHGCIHVNPPTCDDNIDCTVDTCDENAVDYCAHDPDHGLCPVTGDLCDPAESSDETGCYTPPECDEDADCADSLVCNGTETCHLGACVAGTRPSCDDGVACTVDRCDSQLDDCVNEPDNSACDNGVYCDGQETCDADQGCVPGNPPVACLLTCTAVAPTGGSSGISQQLTLTGTHILGTTRARLVASNGALTALGVVTPSADGLTGTVTLPAGMVATGTYSVQLYNAQVSPTCGDFVVQAPLSCGEVTPTTISNTRDETLTMVGSRIVDGAEVFLKDIDTDEELLVGTVTVNPGTGTSSVGVAAGTVESGIYLVRVVNPDAEEALCMSTIRVTRLAPPTVTAVAPDVVWEGDPDDELLSDESVTITGTGFLVTPSVTWIPMDEPNERFNAVEVIWTSATQITAVCPTETLDMPTGFYYVLVTNPDGLSEYWRDPDSGDKALFEVVSDPPPRILTIDPVRGPAASAVELTVTGTGFASNAELYMVDGTNLIPLTGVTFTPGTETTPDELHGTIPAGSLDNGTRYPVRVVNPDDDRYHDYYIYSATSSSDAHLQGGFEPLTDVTLQTGRERLDAVWGYDAFGNGYVYVAGGISDVPEVLDDVEIAPVNIFGDLAPFEQAQQFNSAAEPRVVNRMNEPRHGLALVRSGRYLFAIGGASEVTNTSTCVPALDTVERAQIMGYETMPQAHLPHLYGGSGLAFGTWYYRVSAVGPFGESLASREVQARNTNGRVEICWTSRTPDATSFNIYRSVAADGRAGTTRLLAAEVTSANNCFMDTGRGDFQAAPGRLRSSAVAGGSLAVGFWTYRVTAVVNGRETLAGYREHAEVTTLGTQSVSLRWDPVPNATYNVYRTQAVAVAPTGSEQTYQLITGLTTNSYVDSGSRNVTLNRPAPDGIAPLPTGSLTKWEMLSETLTVPREGPDGLAMAVPSMINDNGETDRTFIYLAGGRPHNFGVGAGCPVTDVYHNTLERVEVFADGSLGDWAQESNRMNTPRAFLVLLNSYGRNDAVFPPPPEDPGCPDNDGDGHEAAACGGDDCNDADPDIYPGAPEICGDGIDQDCDGFDEECVCADPDGDDDGFDRPECGGIDCDDTNSSVYPGAPEVCEDGIDQDCDGFDEECLCADPDADNDGWDRPECGGEDCDDSDPGVNPGAREIFCDGVDQDCDGLDACFPDSSIDEAIYLVASHGDNVLNGGGNAGLQTFEACRVWPPAGGISLWTTQDTDTSQSYHGHGALLYFDTVWVFGGVKSERLGQDPSPLTAAGTRRPFHVDAAPLSTSPWTPSDVLLEDNTQASSVSWDTPRSYYGMVRANSMIFAIGGNDGRGPIDSVEWHIE